MVSEPLLLLGSRLIINYSNVLHELSSCFDEMVDFYHNIVGNFNFATLPTFFTRNIFDNNNGVANLNRIYSSAMNDITFTYRSKS